MWNVALTFSAVTIRMYLPLGIVMMRGDFAPPYRVVAWLCWVPNIPVVELYRWWSQRATTTVATTTTCPISTTQ